MIHRFLLLTTLLAPSVGLAGEPMMRVLDANFEDVAFDLENAIVNQGLVIDWISHIGNMLDRTGDAVDGSEPIYTQAAVYNFCSAQLSRQVMQLNPTNIQYCPYGIFVYEAVDAAGQVVIGHTVFDSPDMAEVNALLDKIIADVTGE